MWASTAPEKWICRRFPDTLPKSNHEVPIRDSETRTRRVSAWSSNYSLAGTKHKKVQENLPEKANSLTSTKLPTYEATLSQMKELDRERKEDIHGIKGD